MSIVRIEPIFTSLEDSLNRFFTIRHTSNMPKGKPKVAKLYMVPVSLQCFELGKSLKNHGMGILLERFFGTSLAPDVPSTISRLSAIDVAIEKRAAKSKVSSLCSGKSDFQNLVPVAPHASERSLKIYH